MDPLTQGALGAALPQATYANGAASREYQLAIAGALGMLGGMAADLDVLITSDTDPLLFLTYHRQFTHSLFFIPIGGLIVGLVLHWIFGRRWQLQVWQTVLLCSLGYATHALLDTATSYGTMLLWPFVETRFALSIISVVDPLFTLPLLLFVLIAALRSKPMLARAGLIWAFIYLGFGWWQHQTAWDMATALASSRGHTPVRLEVKPSFGNVVVWKSIYEADGTFFVDAIRPRFTPAVIEGDSVRKLNTARDFPWLSPETQQARDINRFVHFSDGYAAVDPEAPMRIIDARYSFVPNEISALFSIELSADAEKTSHVRYVSHRERAREQFGRLWQLIVGWAAN